MKRLAGRAAWSVGAVLAAWGAAPLSAPAQAPRGPLGPAAVPAAAPAEAAPQAPFAELSPAHQQYLDQILAAWEERSAAIRRYRCVFSRWEYDPVFGPRETYKSFSEGTLKYQAPDKGLYQVLRTLYYTPPAAPDQKPQFLEKEGDHGDHWVCDGQSVFEFDGRQKRVVERPLPPELQGQAIVDGPLPFLFGAKADKIKARYWLRVVTPPGVEGEYWLEAYPKTRGDAANFKKVEVIIDGKDFLPRALQLFDRNYDERTNPARTVYMFDKREINFRDLDDLNPFHKEFFVPKVPSGWQRVVEQVPGSEPAAPPQTAQQPSFFPRLPFGSPQR